MLSSSEQIRYLRQILLPEFGVALQEKLKASKVFIVGAGGLGSPVSYYLAAAGVGRIELCDKDVVELSNLNRQTLHTTSDIQVPKSESASQKLRALNPEILIETHQVEINRQVLHQMAGDSDIVVDCLDNVKTRLEINQFCLETRIPVLHAGIDGWNAQLTLIHPPTTACMQCLFEHYKESDKPKPVLGAVAGIVGTTQALEVIKYLTGMETGLLNQLLLFDGLHMEWHKLPIAKNEACPACGSL